LNNDAAWLRMLFTVAARTVGGQAQRFETSTRQQGKKKYAQTIGNDEHETFGND
jgi:hypothetical protein